MDLESKTVGTGAPVTLLLQICRDFIFDSFRSHRLTTLLGVYFQVLLPLKVDELSAVHYSMVIGDGKKT